MILRLLGVQIFHIVKFVHAAILHFCEKMHRLTTNSANRNVFFMGNSILNRRMCYVFWPGMISGLIAANIVLYALAAFLFPRLTYILSMVPALVYYNHWYWQFVTYMFMHGGVWHLVFNMLALYMFGMPVSRSIGSNEFLLFYLLTGTLSGIASFFTFLLSGHNYILLGASGAIYGVMLLFSVFFPNAVVYVFGMIPVRAPMLMVIYFLIEFLGSISSYGGVAHVTHLFGLLFAFLYCLIRFRIKPWRVWGF